MKNRNQLLLTVLGGSGFNPLSIPNLALWLDASDASTLFQDSGGTTAAAADGDVVGYAKDKGTNLWNATQGTALNKPILKLAIQNGRNVIRFDGSNDVLSTPTAAKALFRNKGYGYIFMGVAPNNTASGTTRSLLHVYTPGGAARLALVEGTVANKFSLFAKRLDADGGVSFNSSVNHGGTFHVVSVLSAWADNSLILRQDGVQVGSVAYGSSGNTSDTDSIETPSVGAVAGANPSLADIGEVIVATPSTALSAGAIAQIEAYLMAKWGVS